MEIGIDSFGAASTLRRVARCRSGFGFCWQCRRRPAEVQG